MMNADQAKTEGLMGKAYDVNKNNEPKSFGFGSKSFFSA
jgi:hypothetical protein